MLDDTPMVNVVIADRHEIVRDAIAMRLQNGAIAHVSGTATDGYSAIKLCRSLQPDILLLDFDIKRSSGRETFLKLRQSQPNLKIIVICEDSDIADAFFLMSKGAYGLMTRDAKGADFERTIQSVAAEYAIFPKEYLAQFAEIRTKATKSGNVYGLSPRELEVLRESKNGACTKQIAEQLNISVRTVETHRYSIYRKTACNNIDELHDLFWKVDVSVD